MLARAVKATADSMHGGLLRNTGASCASTTDCPASAGSCIMVPVWTSPPPDCTATPTAATVPAFRQCTKQATTSGRHCRHGYLLQRRLRLAQGRPPLTPTSSPKPARVWTATACYPDGQPFSPATAQQQECRAYPKPTARPERSRESWRDPQDPALVA